MIVYGPPRRPQRERLFPSFREVKHSGLSFNKGHSLPAVVAYGFLFLYTKRRFHDSSLAGDFCMDQYTVPRTKDILSTDDSDTEKGKKKKA